MAEEQVSEQQIRRRTMLSFIGFGLAAIVPFGLWKWIGTSPADAGVKRPLRRVLEANAGVGRGILSPTHLAPTFPKEQAAANPRVNGWDGIRSAVPAAQGYTVRVEQPGKPVLTVSLDEIKQLPKHEMIYEFKCIEGWSEVQHWGGVRLLDFVQKYGLGGKTGAATPDQPNNWYQYVGMETPDKGYYVGIDMGSALHPQTMLAYEVNGQPITGPHGAPLRLIIPVKYGVKNLKRIGTIVFTDERPRDFWAERGYDYFVGL